MTEELRCPWCGFETMTTYEMASHLYQLNHNAVNSRSFWYTIANMITEQERNKERKLLE